MNRRVDIVEVGPRDGLQNEAGVIPVTDKIALIDLLTASGLPEVEVGSFVSPKWVPQMADTPAVMSGIERAGAVRLTVLVPNLKGWEAFKSQSPEPIQRFQIAVFVSASEGFSQANLNCSVEESLARVAPVVAAATSLGVSVRGYVSCVTDCPFDGPTDPARVAAVVGTLRQFAPMQVSLGDTIGKGRPETVAAMLDKVLDVAPPKALAGHFHDTGGRALDNIETSLEKGLRVFDASVGGLGGCPYAPGAPGNVATERVIERVEALGYRTGIDRGKIDVAARMARTMRGMAHV